MESDEIVTWTKLIIKQGSILLARITMCSDNVPLHVLSIPLSPVFRQPFSEMTMHKCHYNIELYHLKVLWGVADDSSKLCVCIPAKQFFHGSWRDLTTSLVMFTCASWHSYHQVVVFILHKCNFSMHGFITKMVVINSTNISQLSAENKSHWQTWSDCK